MGLVGGDAETPSLGKERTRVGGAAMDLLDERGEPQRGAHGATAIF